MREEQGITSDEKFSTYLRKLEKTDGITPEERKAYIGIYRLLHQVEKSDGAALGAVLKAGQEVTLEHLLTAVRTHRKGGMDAAVDDAFGMLQEVSYDGETITDQLADMKQLLKQMKDFLSPGKLKNIPEMPTQAEEGQEPSAIRLLNNKKNHCLPGSAQVLAGNRRLGRFGIGATLTMWVLVIFGVLSALLWRTMLVTLATNWFFLFAVQIVLIGYAVLWTVLTIDTLRLVRLVKTGGGARFGIALLSVVLLFVAGGGAVYASQLAGTLMCGKRL